MRNPAEASRRLARTLLIWQIILTGFTALLFLLVSGGWDALGALAGGAANIVGQGVFALFTLSRGVVDSTVFLGRAARAELLKLALSATILALGLGWLELGIIPLLSGYLATLLAWVPAVKTS